MQVSMIDAANACVFIDASSLGLAGTELPDELDARPELLARIASIREHASVAMGIAADLQAARMKRLIPLVAIVSAPQESATLDGSRLPEASADLTVRMISSGQPHRALPLTGSLCVAVASAIEGTVAARRVRRQRSGSLRLGMPSGVITVAAEVTGGPQEWRALHGSFYRTTRRLFEGMVYA
jgi:2-methylaconitate cis-trans-isomerase PrpF